MVRWPFLDIMSLEVVRARVIVTIEAYLASWLEQVGIPTYVVCTARSRDSWTEFFFLSFPLLLCLKLVADASPHHGVLVRHFIRGRHHACGLTLSTLSPLIRL